MRTFQKTTKNFASMKPVATRKQSTQEGMVWLISLEWYHIHIAPMNAWRLFSLFIM